MRQRVTDGVYSPGGQLPGVAKICEEFDCSTATAVKVMGELSKEGYVTARQGVGYFAPQTLPILTDDMCTRQKAQRDIVASLRSEARRLQEIADRLDRSIR